MLVEIKVLNSLEQTTDSIENAKVMEGVIGLGSELYVAHEALDFLPGNKINHKYFLTKDFLMYYSSLLSEPNIGEEELDNLKHDIILVINFLLEDENNTITENNRKEYNTILKEKLKSDAGREWFSIE